MSNIFNSSIGKKLMMSLMGLFLISFLLVHLGINLLLIFYKSREPFNIAAHFMSTNIVIRILEVVLFGGFLLHIIYGLILQVQNWIARPVRYRKANFSQTSFFSKFMIHTAAVIGIFLVVHLIDFYFRSRFSGTIPVVEYNGKEYHDLGLLVIQKFQHSGFVIGYIVSFLFMAFHLLHGFQSAFQTLGLNHKVYTPVIKAIGIIYTIVITAGFTIIPIYIYYFM